MNGKKPKTKTATVKNKDAKYPKRVRFMEIAIEYDAVVKEKKPA